MVFGACRNHPFEKAKFQARGLQVILEVCGDGRGCTPYCFRKSGKYRTYGFKSEKSEGKELEMRGGRRGLEAGT